MIESARHETPSTVGSHYDDLDRYYREVWGPHVHHGLFTTGDESVDEATEELVHHLFRDVPLTSASKVCDIGCGYGETSRLLVRETGATVTGYTVSQAQAAYARQAGDATNPTIRVGDWLANDLPASSQDLAFSIESSEHMPDLERFFAESYRVLRPGGQLRVCAWLAKEQPAAWERALLLQPICTEGRLRLGTPSEYRALMEQVGYIVDDYEDLTDRVKATWTICLKRMAARLATGTSDWKFLLTNPSRNKSFLLSLLRIRLAYETRSMTYGLFRATKR